MTYEEVLTWHRPADKMPDDDQTVMIHTPTSDEPVWFGWFDGEVWNSVEGFQLSAEVRAWAPVPEGWP